MTALLNRLGKVGSVGGLDASGGPRGGGIGRYKNAGGRGYYTDPSANLIGRQRDAAQNNNPLVGLPVDSVVLAQQRQKCHQKTSSSASLSNQNNQGTFQGRKIVSDVEHLYDVVDDKPAYENYDTLMEITSKACEQAMERLGDYNSGDDSGSSRGRRSGGSLHGRRGSSKDANNQEQKANWARMKEEELVDRMLSQFPVS